MTDKRKALLTQINTTTKVKVLVKNINLKMANAATAAAATAATAPEAQLTVEQSKLPLFHADPKRDQFRGDQWLERFENSRESCNWNAQRTNALQDAALSWYRMLSVVKIDTNDNQAVRTAFLQNFGVQTNNCVVITDFTNMKQKKDETVQQFFTRISDIACIYNLKKLNDDIMGPLWAILEEHTATLVAYDTFPVATKILIQRLNYEQTARNDISFLGLQFFITGLHTNISLEVIKSNTTNMYEAFLIPHAYKTAVKCKKEKDAGIVKINKMDADFEDEDERTDIEAIKCRHQQKRMFRANNGSAINSAPMGAMA